MYYTVAEIAEKLGLSKQGVYNKIKSSDVKAHTSKKKGVTYVDDEGLKLIEESVNSFTPVEPEMSTNTENTANDSELNSSEDVEMSGNDLINYLKEENERLWAELAEKNNQIANMSRLIENSQVLLKDKKEAVNLLENTEKEEPVIEESFFKKFFGIKK